MVVFSTKKYQLMAELLQRIQGQIEGEGGETWVRTEEDLFEAARQAGIDLETARIVDARTLEAILAGGASPDPGRCWAVAEVLYLDGLLAMARGEEEVAHSLLEKARGLYGHVDDDMVLPDEAVEPGERLRRIEEITGA